MIDPPALGLAPVPGAKGEIEMSSFRFGRILQSATVVLAVAVVPAAASTLIGLLPYSESRDVRWPILAAELLAELPFTALGVLGWLAIRSALDPRLGGRSAWVAALAFLPSAYRLLAKLNRAVLPGFFELESLIGNALALTAAAAAIGGLVFLLVRWTSSRAWSEGAMTVVPFLLVALPLGGVLGMGRRVEAASPSIVVILIDVLRAGRLGCYGYERDTSPNIDRFAEDAIVFDYGISASTFTKTSVASLFTGLPAHQHNVLFGDLTDEEGQISSDVLASRFDTVAERMFALGLHTEAWVQNGQLRDYMGFAQGFARYHDQPGDAPTITGLHRAWLRGPTSSLPSFTYLHILDLHAPYNPPPPYYGRFGPTERGLPHGLGYGEWAQYKDRIRRGEHKVTQDELGALLDRHDECLAHVDHWVGTILDDLKRYGKYDNSLVIVTGDHGDAFGEHGVISHSTHPFDELVHVPLIVKMPRAKHAGARVPQMVSHVDVLATLEEFLGGDPGRVPRESFLALLNDPGTPLPPRERFVEVHRTGGVRTDRWKYIQGARNAPLLFDLDADPGEQTNVADEYPEEAKHFAAKVRAAAEFRQAVRNPERVVVDDETVRRLRELGYM